MPAKKLFKRRLQRVADDSDPEDAQAPSHAAGLHKVLMEKANIGAQDQSSENNTNV